MSRIAVNNVPRRPTGRLKPQHNLILRGPVSREDLLAHTDPGPPEEAEELVRLIYALRRKTKPRQLPE
jgi:hypothetical protein